MKIDWKKTAPYLVALVTFIGFAVVYCSPMLDGKVLYAGDTFTWLGGAHQTMEYRANTGESCWWTNSMFSGMPTYQVDAHIPSHKISHGIIGNNILHVSLPETMGILFGYFIGFYILLLCFGVNPWLSIAGALGMGMSSYFFLIVPAGHITKALALGWLPPLIGGIHLIFKRNYWLGIPIALIFGMTSIVRHPQMTYYIAMLIGVMVIAEIYLQIRDKEWKNIGTSLAICIACLLLIVGSKACYLTINNEYVKETMRGGHSELHQAEKTDTQKAGLDIKYATDWSYGKAETMTLLIPNWEGGASGYNVGKDSQLCKAMRSKGVPKRDAESFCEHVPTYHGEKMFTSGAVYVGAIICFLFVVGLLIVPGAYKWALLFATLMSIFLAWGKNMMWLTELFFQYFPMYNKFRAVESILVVAEITMPLLGFMGLQRIVNGEIEWKKLRNSLLIAGGITGGLCLFAALFAGSFDMTSSYDAQWKAQVPDWLYDMILDQRVAMVKDDAWRSLMFVVLGFAVIYWYAWQNNKNGYQTKQAAILYAGLAILVIADMTPVNKRFFNDSNFVKQKESDAYFKMQPYEEQILQDKSLDYRVLNLAANTFNDSRTSYRLNSIGGYSAVKLRRYQDLIDEHISKMNWNVLNMLNTKYIVTQRGVIPNPDAMGNAWFVNDIQFVPTPDDESAALNTLNLHTSAVADEKFREVLTCVGTPDESDEIIMTEYTPNRLTYSTRNAQDRVAVFSEIYYPHGWHLYVDGQEIEIGRVNYVLRAAVIPAGEHTIHMEFVPEALVWDKLGYACVILILLISVLLLSWAAWKPKKTSLTPAQ